MAFYHGLHQYSNPRTDPNHYPGKQAWIAARLLTLRHDLNETIQKDRAPNSLIIGSWNIRAFDGGMLRMDESYHYIAEIIGHFDICALQEIRPDLAPLRRLVKLLGPNWDFFVSDVSVHKGGNNERIAYVYNKSKVHFRNLIGEIVLPREDIIQNEQIARSPLFASFQAGWFKFSLTSAHVLFADDLQVRAAEIRAITKALVKRAESEDQVHILLGDMNIEKADGIVMKALKDSQMIIPEFGGTNMDGSKWFDQIAFTVKGKATHKTRLLRHGKFDWRHAVFGPHPKDQPQAPLSQIDIDNGLSRPTLEEMLSHYQTPVEKLRAQIGKTPYRNWPSQYSKWTTHEMSDHLPIWVELETDYSDDYLRKFL